MRRVNNGLPCGSLRRMRAVDEKLFFKFFLFIFIFSRGNQHPLPPPLALGVEVLDKNWTEIKGSNLNN